MQTGLVLGTRPSGSLSDDRLVVVPPNIDDPITVGHQESEPSIWTRSRSSRSP